MGLKLLVARVSELHNAIAYDARNDAAYGGECKEEGFGFAGPPHDPFPRHLSLSSRRPTPPFSKPYKYFFFSKQQIYCTIFLIYFW